MSVLLEKGRAVRTKEQREGNVSAGHADEAQVSPPLPSGREHKALLSLHGTTMQAKCTAMKERKGEIENSEKETSTVSLNKESRVGKLENGRRGVVRVREEQERERET